MSYETLLKEAESVGVTVKEKPLKYNDGRQKGNRIAIRKNIETEKQKSCVLAEELGHFYTTVGDILDQSSTSNRKQEYRARMWAYNKVIGLSGIIECHNHFCSGLSDMADYLNVTEEFLLEAIECYKSKYGIYAKIDNYVIFFEPLGVFELYK